MAVSLSPTDFLGFRRPLTQPAQSPLIITNNNNKPIAFKIKATAPKWYVVRPNSGRIEPGEHAEIIVIRQAFIEEPQLNARSTHKFLIQSKVITPEKENLSPNEIFASPAARQEGKTYQQKVRVSYLPELTETLDEGKDIPANIAITVISRKPFLQTILQQDPQPESRNEPPPLEDPHRSTELSPPSHSGTGAAHDFEQGDAPHGGSLLLQEDELSCPNATLFHVSLDAEQTAQPIAKSPEREPGQAPPSAIAFTSTAIIVSQENPGEASVYEEQGMESNISTSNTTRAAASPLYQHTTVPLVNATETDVRTTVCIAEAVTPLRVVVGVLVLVVIFSVC